MTQRAYYIRLLAAEADRHLAMAQTAENQTMRNDQLDVSLACWVGVAALEKEESICGLEKKRHLSPRRFWRRCLGRIRRLAGATRAK